MRSTDAFWHQQHMVVWLIVAILVVMVVLFFWRGHRNDREPKETPEQWLKRRYAQAEIDVQIYRHMLCELRK